MRDRPPGSPPPRLVGDLPVSPVGLGGASWSLVDLPGSGTAPTPERSADAAVRTVHAALDAGVTLIDTARAYTTATDRGHNEALIRRALAEHPLGPRAVVATKGGHYRRGDTFPVDASPDALRRDCAASRELLGVERIDLYQLHHPDPHVPLCESVAALAALQAQGWVRHIGVSNVSLAQLEEAISVAPIASVQNHFSPLDQSDRPTVDYCAERSIAYLAYSPLGGGPGVRGRGALRAAFPAAAAAADARGISLERLALAWLLELSPTIVPVCGASRPESIRDSAQAAGLALTEPELAGLDFER